MLPTDMIRALEDVLDRKERVDRMNEQIQDDIKAIAERFEMKPARVRKILTLMDQEKRKGGVIEEAMETLEMAKSATGA